VGNKLVIVVDEEEINREMIGRVLESQGYSVLKTIRLFNKSAFEA